MPYKDRVAKAEFLKAYCRTEPAKEYQRIWKRQRRKNQRMEALDLLGGPLCKRCGFADIRALQIDHVNGGGVKEHRAVGWGHGVNRLVIADSDRLLKYQVLCANCNWIKRFENKEF